MTGMDESSAVLAYMAIVQKHPSYGMHYADVKVTSHHITSHHITSHDMTSHRITSHHITSHQITSHHITSHHITSPHRITSHHTTFQDSKGVPWKIGTSSAGIFLYDFNDLSRPRDVCYAHWPYIQALHESKRLHHITIPHTTPLSWPTITQTYRWTELRGVSFTKDKFVMELAVPMTDDDVHESKGTTSDSMLMRAACVLIAVM